LNFFIRYLLFHLRFDSDAKHVGYSREILASIEVMLIN